MQENWLVSSGKTGPALNVLADLKENREPAAVWRQVRGPFSKNGDHCESCASPRVPETERF